MLNSAEMKLATLLSELEAAAAALGIQVSYEALVSQVGSGGLCRVKGEYRAIIDKRVGAEERATTLAHALAGFDLSGLQMSRETRALVAHCALSRAS